LLNIYSFFALYANIDKFNYSEEKITFEKRPEIDRWILSKLGSIIIEYNKNMDGYNLTKAARLVSDFTIDQLSNWYIRRCRRRFWKSEMNENKLSAYQTLYECLITIIKMAAPFIPFITEELYLNLNSVTKKENFESIHLSHIPKPEYSNKELEDKMEIAQQVVYLTRAMRAKANLKVRQPLEKIMVVVDKSKQNAVKQMQDVILDEVNIKELVLLDDDSGIVNKTAKPNFKSIGPKFGKNVKKVAEAIRNFTKENIDSLVTNHNIDITIDGKSLAIALEDVEILGSEIKGWVVESTEGVTVAIDSELSDELIAEGLAREFVNRIQNMRKDSGFNVTDRIKIEYSGNKKLNSAINMFCDYVSNETLADEIKNVENFNGADKTDWQINDINCSIRLERVKS